MAWRLAESLKKLREQINAAYPTRSKVSDGSIGNEAHAATKSDHNPNAQGVVCAVDVTNDIKTLGGQMLADALVKSRDRRIKYLIFNHQMISSYASGNYPAWRWRPYSGANAHTHHVHISVKESPLLYDSQAEWYLGFGSANNLEASAIQPESAVADSITAEPQDFPLARLLSDSATLATSEAVNEAPIAAIAAPDATSQTVETGGTGILVAPNASTGVLPIVSSPGDAPVQATTGGFKSMVTSAVGWITGAGAGLIALLKDNQTLLIIAGVIVVIAGILYFVRQLVLDRDRLKIAADPTKWNAK